MKYVSRNLWFLRENDDDMKAALNVRHRTGHRKEPKGSAELRVCLEFFREKKILERKDRTLIEFFAVDMKKVTAKKLARLHGDLEQRALEETTSTFLPKFMRGLRSEIEPVGYDDVEEDAVNVPHKDDPEREAGFSDDEQPQNDSDEE